MGNTDTASLIADAGWRRMRLANNLEELSERMTPQNLLHEGLEQAKQAARDEAGKAARQLSDFATDIAHDSATWARDNKRLLAGGSIMALLALLLGWKYRRKRDETRNTPVPLYAAYAMEDPAMMNEADSTTWDRVKDEASHLSAKAGETYYAARSRAALLADTASEKAGDAREWAAKQPDEHPASLVIVGVAVGAILAVLLPTRKRPLTREWLREDPAGFARAAAARGRAEAKHRYENAASHVQADADKAKSAFYHLADIASEVVQEVGDAALKKLKQKL